MVPASRSLLLLLLLVGCGLAGCATKPPGSGTDTLAKAAESLDVKASATTGVIRGIVVDQAIRPIANVTVRNSCLNRTAVSNQAGAYGFDSLPAGTCFLTFTKKGYTTTQSSTDVKAGVDDPPIVRTQLQQLQSLKPYHDVVKFHGNQALGTTVLVPGLGDVKFVSGTQILFQGIFAWSFDMSPPPQWDQLIVAWQAKTPLSENLNLDRCVVVAKGSDCAWSSSNFTTSPLVMDPDAKLAKVFADAVAANQTVSDLGTMWAGHATGQAADAGVTVDQDFETVLVRTYNYQPPASYRFDTDGEPVDPSA